MFRAKVGNGGINADLDLRRLKNVYFESVHENPSKMNCELSEESGQLSRFREVTKHSVSS